MARFETLLLVAGITLIPRPGEANPSFLEQVPNGENPNLLGRDACGICHVRPQGDGDRNSFGQAFEDAFGRDRWGRLYRLDSDGDGQTNGFELGDPMGVWTPGATPERTDYLSNPGDPAHMSFPPGFDAGIRDTGAPEVGEDAGDEDAGTRDAEVGVPEDTGPPDTGAGEEDVGSPPEDAGTLDQGRRELPTLPSPDAGPREPKEDGCRCARGGAGGSGWGALLMMLGAAALTGLNSSWRARSGARSRRRSGERRGWCHRGG